jgi:alkylresorcinol/alkylpyrone synthase
MVSIETCTLSFRSDRLRKADIIATVLFGDGAAAACLSTDPGEADFPMVRLSAGCERIWPDTLDIMGWEVDAAGLGVIFDRSIPEFVRAAMGEAVAGALAASDLTQAEIARFICHPGGAKVVEALEGALGLASGTLVEERGVLRDFGNMSAPTILFVLDRVLSKGTEGRMLLSALGPGFTASFLPLRVGRFNA